MEEKLNPKFIHFEFDTFNPDLDLGSLTLNTQDSGNSQTQSQSTSQTINKQGDAGTTDDDVMNAEEGEVKAVVVSRNRFLKGMETTDSPKGTVYQNQTQNSRKSGRSRIPTVKLKIPGKTFLKSESRTSVTFKL